MFPLHCVLSMTSCLVTTSLQSVPLHIVWMKMECGASTPMSCAVLGTFWGGTVVRRSLFSCVAFDGCWYTKIYDKREHPPLSRIDALKYPHPSCFISERAKLGIITSRLHGFGRICTRRSDFIERARMFLREFRGRGYSVSRMWGYVLRFLRKVPLAFPVTSPSSLARELLRREVP